MAGTNQPKQVKKLLSIIEKQALAQLRKLGIIVEKRKSFTSNQIQQVERIASIKCSEKPTSVRICIGDTVMVDSRTWPGMNKPGGIGRVSGINDNSTFNTGTYCMLIKRSTSGERFKQSIQIPFVGNLIV